jgi:ubiquinone biosynthesis protein COQ9
MTDIILTPNKFALIIENIVKDRNITYMDAVLEYCKIHDIDPSDTKAMVSKTLKEKIAYEAQNLNMLKEKVAKLPI